MGDENKVTGLADFAKRNCVNPPPEEQKVQPQLITIVTPGRVFVQANFTIQAGTALVIDTTKSGIQTVQGVAPSSE